MKRVSVSRLTTIVVIAGLAMGAPHCSSVGSGSGDGPPTGPESDPPAPPADPPPAPPTAPPPAPPTAPPPTPPAPPPSAGSGSIEVTIKTVGDELDPDGYSLVVDGGAGQATGLNDQLTLTDLTAGVHTLELTGVAENCRVTPVDQPTSTSVTANETTAVSLEVFCLPPGAGTIYFKTQIFLFGSMNANGGDQRIIGRAIGEPVGFPSISPDGTMIAYAAVFSDGTRGGVFLMDQNGQNAGILTSGEGCYRSVAWSPDGNRILFARAIGHCGNPFDIFVMNADGSGIVNLTNSEAATDRDPDWSPDGNQIAYSSGRRGAEQIYVMNSDGSDPRRLTDGVLDHVPDWSPNGTQIAFRRQLSSVSNHEIFVMNADGSGLDQLTSTGAFRSGGPSWSPDGRRIAFGSDRSGVNSIHVMLADGTEVVHLKPGVLPVGDTAPLWEP